MIISYQNAKEQNVFLSISRYKFAPFFQNILIFDNSSSIENIIVNGFEYTIIDKKEMDVGVKFKNIWKPFIQDKVTRELNFDIPTLYRTKRNLSILVQKLQEILLFVEPSRNCLQTYSHKIKELLILACTEIENSFKTYNFGKNERTTDYVKILNYIDLSKHKVSLIGYADEFKSCPFENWNNREPTKSLPWYEAYTKIKHNSDENFHFATLKHCLNAVMANIVLFVVRYSTKYLYKENDICSSLINSYFDFRIEDCLDFYIPLIECIPIYPYAEQPYDFYNGTIVTEITGKNKLVPYEEREVK